MPPPQTILEEIGCHLREFAWPDRWFYGKQQRMTDASITVGFRGTTLSLPCIPSPTQDPSLERLHATMERIGDVPTPPIGQDESAAHWLARQPGIDATYVEVVAAHAVATHVSSTTGPLQRQMHVTPMTLAAGSPSWASRR